MALRRQLHLWCGLSAFLLLPLAGCQQAALRYNTRYLALLKQRNPTILPIPVLGVAASQLRDSWGEPRSGRRRHKGIDILAPRHTPIRAVTEGVVETKGMRGLGGQVVTVIGPGGYRHYYAHLEDYGPQAVGDWVDAGEILGTVGTSGNAAVSPPHLHYGLYTSGWKAINPYPFLRKYREPANLVAP